MVPRAGVLYLCFFISGAAALVYEIVWQRMLTLVFGLSTMSVAAVLSAFLAGLALGALLLAGVADRSRSPAKLYAVIELSIAAFGLASGFVIDPITRLFVALHGLSEPGWLASNLIRFILAFVAFAIPSVLIGATVPVMSRLVATRAGSLAVGFGRFYAVNTFGAVAGAALAGFVLMRELGVQRSLYVAVAGNLLVAALALVVSSRFKTAGESAAHPEFDGEAQLVRPPLRRFALVAAAITGAAALGYEVAWARVLAIYTLNSVYVFTMIVTVYLAALALGAALATRLIRGRQRSTVTTLIVAQTLLALLAPVTLACLPRAAALDIGAAPQTEGQVFATEYLLTVAIVFVPTVLMGMTLPLLVELNAGVASGAGRSVARIYAWNALGTISGAAVTGTLLVPLIGLRDTIMLLAVVNYLVAVTATVFDSDATLGTSRFRRALTPLSAAAFVLMVALLPPSFRFYRPSREPDERLLYYAEGPSATVHVNELERDGRRYRTLYVDSESVAGTSDEIVTDQKMLAHLPLLLHPAPQRALTVGFGTGGTSYSMLQHKLRVECVEIEPTVPAAYALFESENAKIVGPQHDRHDFQLILDDARSWLNLVREPYDVIVTDVTSIQYRGNGNLYTTDYFALMKSRLTAAGVAAAWAPATGITPEQLKLLIRSFRQVFPHTSVWYMLNLPTDFVIVVGTPRPLALDLASMAARMSAPLVQRDLAKIGLDQPYKLAACLLLAEEGVAAYLGAGSELPVHTDDRPILDYLTHAGRHQNTLAANLSEMRAYRGDPAESIVTWPGHITREAALPEWQRWNRAAACLIEGHLLARSQPPGRDDGALAAYRAAAALVPEDARTRALVAARE